MLEMGQGVFDLSQVTAEIHHLLLSRKFQLQRVPALRAFWDLEKTVLHETRVSETVLWSPTNANSPTYTYISPKTVVVETVLVIFV